ncbi:Ig-like domain-containing protein [Arthrobacter sp. LAPM80]|uniref:Ig-like domain-containing protein n=1 Tax=Arthrobacter sp. LAPM80 TaxID=3141788 RepID=UPI00398B8901
MKFHPLARNPGHTGTAMLAALVLPFAALVGLPLARARAAAAVTLPDVRIQVPASLIAIGIDPATAHPVLRSTHITWDAGTSTFVPSIGVFSPPSEYQFPLTRFTLNAVSPDGSIGSVVATSAKSDYCITGDNRVGGVANTPAQTFIPQSNCTDPSKPRGWSVGWGDQYDQTDAGQPIDLNGVPAGTYILRAIADPQYVPVDADSTNNVTDTTLAISGTQVTVLSQSNPGVTPPTVSLTQPAPNSVVGGTVTVSATAAATAPATIASVQFLLDGLPLGAPVTAAPYNFAWTVGSTPISSHTLSARATDSAGNSGTATAVTVNVLPQPGTVSVDASVAAQGGGGAATPAFSTSVAGETLLAEVSTDGPTAAGQTATVSGAGLSWSLVKRANSVSGAAEIWTAKAPAILSNVVVTSKATQGGASQQLSVQAFINAAGVGASTAASAATGAPSLFLMATAAGSVVYAVGHDWDNATAHVPGTGQALINQWLDTGSGDTYWVQSTTAATTAAGRTVAVNDTSPTTDQWNLAAVEVTLAGTTPPPVDTVPPTVAIINPTAGQVVSGQISVAANASDNVGAASFQFLLDGKALGAASTAPPYALAWDTTTATAGTHALSAVATDPSGNTGTAATVTVTVQNPGPPMTCFVLQTQTSVHGRGTLKAPSFKTAMAGSYAQSGDAEVWQASAPAILGAATITSALSSAGYSQNLAVAAFEGAKGIGAIATGSATTGAPHVNVTTTAAASPVFGVGHDWDNAVTRTLPTGFVMSNQYLDNSSGDTAWAEYTNQITGAAGTIVSIGATAPTTDQWNMVGVELLNSGN